MNRSRRALLLAAGIFLAACANLDDPTGAPGQSLQVSRGVAAGRQPRVTFVIDDGRSTDWTLKLPIFQARGAVAVAAVPSEWRQLTDEQLLALQDVYGWEIANHGKRHRNETLISDADLEEELFESRAAFARIGLHVTVHVYPFGASNQRVEDAVARYFRAGVLAWGGTNHLPLRNRYQITRSILDRGFLDSVKANTVLGKSGLRTPYTREWWRNLVRKIQRNREWLIVSIHELPPADIGVLADMIDYTQSRGIPIVTLSQGLDMP